MAHQMQVRLSTKPHVLILESEEYARHALKFLLENAGFTVTFLSSLESRPTNQHPDADAPACLLVNSSLLAMNDLSLWTLAELNSRLPIVFYAFKDNLITQSVALRCRSLTSLPQPIDTGSFLTTVEQIVSARLNLESQEQQRQQLATLIEKLTESEQDVLKLLAEGLTLEDIAQRRGTSRHTVRNQRSRILEKLEARTIADAVRMSLLANAEKPTRSPC